MDVKGLLVGFPQCEEEQQRGSGADSDGAEGERAGAAGVAGHQLLAGGC